ncbi:MAG: aldehyde dehydrogenase family protein [Actinomycetota bacterium]
MTDVVRSSSPQHPGDLVGEWPDDGAAGVNAAVEPGRAAASGWRATSAFERSRELRDAATRLAADSEDLTTLMVREVGKPITEARAEVSRAVSILQFYAQAALDPEGEVLPPSTAGSLLLTRRRPRGLVGLITPWNFPVAIPVWKLAPALAWGNAVVLKPSPESTACAVRLAEVLALPADVLQVVPGAGETGRALVEHEGVDAVSFTGSAAVGREVTVAAARRGIPAQAEMGGQNPCIVLADADIEASAATIANSAMGYAGQKCTAARRVIAVGTSAPAVTDALVASVERLAVGDPSDPDTVVGPLISAAARDRVAGAVDAARSSGARVLTGGARTGDEGWFLSPAVVAGVPPDQELAREEVFGPVCAVFTADDVEEAIQLANATRYGLVAAVFTRDLGVALEMADRLDVGLVRVNAPTTGVDFHAPFGGDKASGQGGREQGRAAREFYSSTATITIAPPA